MAETQETHAVREAVGVFDDADRLQEAVDELLAAGFDRAELSFLASEQTVRHRLGHIYTRVEEAADDPDAPRVVYRSTEARGDALGALIGAPLYVAALGAAGLAVVSGGTLLAAAGAAVAGGAAGGLLGAGLAKALETRNTEVVEEQIRRGDLLLWVGLRDDEHERRAVDILRRNQAHDVHVHALPAAG